MHVGRDPRGLGSEPGATLLCAYAALATPFAAYTRQSIAPGVALRRPRPNVPRPHCRDRVPSDVPHSSVPSSGTRRDGSRVRAESDSSLPGWRSCMEGVAFCGNRLGQSYGCGGRRLPPHQLVVGEQDVTFGSCGTPSCTRHPGDGGCRTSNRIGVRRRCARGGSVGCAL